jgi:hypothetical protein
MAREVPVLDRLNFSTIQWSVFVPPVLILKYNFDLLQKKSIQLLCEIFFLQTAL